MINDYYATTYFNINDAASRSSLSQILRTYSDLGITKTIFSLPYDFSMNVPSNLAKLKYYSSFIKPLIPKNLSLTFVHTISLTEGISTLPDLKELSVSRGKFNFIFLIIPPGLSTDAALLELHNIIFKHRLTPVIAAYLSTRYYLPDKLSKALLNIPNCIYQIDLSNLVDKNNISVVRELYRDNKNIIFGSGTKFDANVYVNFDYYEKRIKAIVGDKNYGFFSLMHNKLF